MDPHGYSLHKPMDDPSRPLPLPTCEDYLTGREFEHHCVARFDRLKSDRWGCFGRYGLSVDVITRLEDNQAVCTMRRSLPDFEGVYGLRGTQAIFDTKVCSSASFPLDKYRISTRSERSRQLRHMYERAGFGVTCFFLIHFNRRRLKSGDVSPITYAFPVRSDHPFWVSFEEGHEKRITRAQFATWATEIGWTRMGKERIARPDIEQAVRSIEGNLAKRGSQLLGSW